MLKLDLSEVGLTTSPFGTQQFMEVAREAIVDDGCREKRKQTTEKQGWGKSPEVSSGRTKISKALNPQLPTVM